jgi:hypothetical protein
LIDSLPIDPVCFYLFGILDRFISFWQKSRDIHGRASGHDVSNN